METTTPSISDATKQHCRNVYRRLVMMALDNQFIYHNAVGDKYHCQIITKLRAAIQQSEELTEEQIVVIASIMEILHREKLGKDQVLEVLDRLMAAELSPLPVLNEEDSHV